MNKDAELEYVFSLWMTGFLDWEHIPGLKEYGENIRNVLKEYRRITKPGKGVSMDESCMLLQDPEDISRELLHGQIEMLQKYCASRNVSMIKRLNETLSISFTRLLGEALQRTAILLRYYAPDGDTHADIIEKLFFQRETRPQGEISREMGMSRATFYRHKTKALMYTGFLFYQVVLPHMKKEALKEGSDPDTAMLR